MTVPYTFSLVRYVHDVVSGEFANVGIVLYAPEHRFLGWMTEKRYSRISNFFGGIQGKHFRRMLHGLEQGLEEIRSQYLEGLRFSSPPADAAKWAQAILPADDSSLQISEARAGIAKQPEEMLEVLFERYIGRYSASTGPKSRQDQEVLPILKEQLRRQKVLGYIRPKLISTPLYEHEFPIAWRNGHWNACEAVSFDLLDASDILEKANRWVGRAHTLRKSDERFRLVLFLGLPREQRLRTTFENAREILTQIPGDYELIQEDQAGDFAEEIAAEVREHESLGS